MSTRHCLVSLLSVPSRLESRRQADLWENLETSFPWGEGKKISLLFFYTRASEMICFKLFLTALLTNIYKAEMAFYLFDQNLFLRSKKCFAKLLKLKLKFKWSLMLFGMLCLACVCNGSVYWSFFWFKIFDLKPTNRFSKCFEYHNICFNIPIEYRQRCLWLIFLSFNLRFIKIKIRLS